MKATYLTGPLSVFFLLFALNAVAQYKPCILSYSPAWSYTQAGAEAPANESACFMALPSSLPAHSPYIKGGSPVSCTIGDNDPFANGQGAYNVLNCTVPGSGDAPWVFYCEINDDDNGYFSTPYWSKGDDGGFNCAFLSHH